MNQCWLARQKSFGRNTSLTLHGPQTGAALLVFFILLFSAAAAVALSALNNRVAVRTSDQSVFSELAQAKEALLSYALLYPDYFAGGPGRLPCPDINNDGLAESNCTSSIIGQLPTDISNSPFVFSNRTTGERFWYAITEQFNGSPSLPPLPVSPPVLNSVNANGEFSLNEQNDIVAVIIDAGPPVGSQTRSSGNPNVLNYLEGGNQAPPDFFTTNANPPLFNDRVAFITGAEIRTQMTVRVAQEIKRVLEMSGPNYPSDPDSLNVEMNAAAAAWYNDDDWESALEDYTLVPPNSATFRFNNCSTTFTVTFGQPGLQRSTGSC